MSGPQYRTSRGRCVLSKHTLRAILMWWALDPRPTRASENGCSVSRAANAGLKPRATDVKTHRSSPGGRHDDATATAVLNGADTRRTSRATATSPSIAANDSHKPGTALFTDTSTRYVPI